MSDGGAGGGVVAIVDAKGRVKEFWRGRTMLLHRDFREPARPYRTVEGEEADRMYREYRTATCRRMTEMLAEPEHAEAAERIIAKMKERGIWTEP